LVYAAKPGGFAYHMWNEVWVGDQWVPLDATLGIKGVGAAHLKIRHTNLHGVSPYTAFLPVYQVLGQLKIEVIEVE
jgi:transglutaminase-like putative cysteine protease